MTDLTFTFTLESGIPDDQSIIIEFPHEQILFDSSTYCEDGSGTLLTCTLSDSSSTFSLTSENWASTGDLSTGGSLTLVLKDAINPSTVPVSISTSIKVWTYNTIESTQVLIDQITSGITITPSLTKTITPSSSSAPSSSSSSPLIINGGCDMGFYWTGTLCDICYDNCKTCDGPTDSNCITRYTGDYLNDGACIATSLPTWAIILISVLSFCCLYSFCNLFLILSTVWVIKIF